MDLPTYTNIWRIEKRLYKLYDFRLPQPLSVVTLGVFLGVLAIWALLLSLLNVPLKTPWHVLWIVPPFCITFLATRPVIEGKRLTELLLSQIRFLAEARVYTRLAPEHEPAEVRVEVRVWHRDPDLPLPSVSKARSKSLAKRASKRSTSAVAGKAAPEPLGLAPASEGAGVPAQGELVSESVALLPEREETAGRPNENEEKAAAGTVRAKRGPEPLKLGRGKPAAEPPEPERQPFEEPEEAEETYEEARDESGAFAEASVDAAPKPEAPAVPVAGDAAEPTVDSGVGRVVERVERIEPVERSIPQDAPEPEPLPEEPEPLPVERARAEAPKAAVSEPLFDKPARGTANAANAVGTEKAREARSAPSAPKRGLGIKVLNYFGFALDKAQPRTPEASAGGKGSAASSDDTVGVNGVNGVNGTEGFDGVDGFDESVSVTRPTSLERAQSTDRARERDRLRRENEEWLKAYRSSDEGASASELEDDAESGVVEAASFAEEDTRRPDPEARRRAEEMMAAPAPAEPHAGSDPLLEAADDGEGDDEVAEAVATAGEPERDESAHRRLRGRIQGKQVERRLARERERVAPPPAREQGQATGAPATPEEAAEQAADTNARRPHAAPWELPEHGGAQQRTEPAEHTENAEQTQQTEQTEHVDRAARTERGAAESGDAPRKSAQEEQIEVLDRHLERLEEQERSADPVPPQPAFAESEAAEGRRRRREGWFSEDAEASRDTQGATARAQGAALGAGVDAGTDAEARTEPVPAEPAPSKDAKPGLQLDHGTGDHESFAATAGASSAKASRPDGSGSPDSFDSADSSDDAPGADKGTEAATFKEPSSAHPRSQSVSPKPATELDHGTGDHESFAATVAPAGTESEAKEAGKAEKTSPAAASTPAAGAAKPATELDHGTGDHESFAATTASGGAGEGVERSAAPGSGGATEKAARGTGEAEPVRASQEAWPEQADEPAPARPAPAKPVSELDHGTGDHESFVAAVAPAEETSSQERSEEAAGRAAASGQTASVKDGSGSQAADRTADNEVAAGKRTAVSEETADPDAASDSVPSQKDGGRRAEQPFAEEAPQGVAHRSAATGKPVGPAHTDTPGDADRARPETPETPETEASRTPARTEAETPTPAPVKPVTELDHGTGEHESFSATVPGGEDHRATEDELSAAEEAALRARQAGATTGRAVPSERPVRPVRRTEQRPERPTQPDQADQADQTDEPVASESPERSKRLSRSMRSSPTDAQRALRRPPKHSTPHDPAASGTDKAGKSDKPEKVEGAGAPEKGPEETASPKAAKAAQTGTGSSGNTSDNTSGKTTATRSAPSERPSEQRPESQPAGSGAAPSDDNGVFSKVAENARRLNSLFGQEGRQGGTSSSRSDGEVVELTPDGSGAANGSAGSGDDPEDKPELQLDHGTGEQRRLTAADRARAAAEASGADTGATRGWRRLARVVTGGSTAPKHELPAGDVARLRMDLSGPRSVVVLGCTGGAGQTITALMLGHTLASYRDERVVAVDVNPGVNGMSRRIRSRTPETLTSLLANAESVDGYTAMRRYTSQTDTGLEVVSTLDDPYVQTLDDRDYAGLTELLASHYEVALLDPAATGVARALPTADGLVLVAPASADAARSVAMTFEWLDGHGYAALRSRSVVVINGVSKRSLSDVDEAEQVARGRCRAIVRVPWDDHVAQGKLGDTGSLRSSTRRAHSALGGVLMHAMSPAGQQPSNRAPSEARR
ncbi:conjugal transfer protein [Nocardiopsis baichengensis]|uniref:conjugal transfer protein n=1 Tax=Nocardiopsis baichengensis TaxID=280240 RepID=UPI00034AE36D|nr:conjugal transfer protein [Nocardiopsis baichengensis]